MNFHKSEQPIVDALAHALPTDVIKYIIVPYCRFPTEEEIQESKKMFRCCLNEFEETRYAWEIYGPDYREVWYISNRLRPSRVRARSQQNWYKFWYKRNCCGCRNKRNCYGCRNNIKASQAMNTQVKQQRTWGQSFRRFFCMR